MTTRLQNLSDALYELYKDRKDLLFHGWHHVYFVSKKAVEFADELGVDKEVIEAAGLVHDLNYVVKTGTEPEAGKELRTSYLQAAGFSPVEITHIERIVMEAHTGTRHADISDAAKVLSDADSVFKVMPLTPILLSSKYITENHVDVKQWARKIIAEQQPLLKQGIYFYTETAKRKYLRWAETDLEIVSQVEDALQDPIIRETLRLTEELGVI